jgi:hypothetical protein
VKLSPPIIVDDAEPLSLLAVAADYHIVRSIVLLDVDQCRGTIRLISRQTRGAARSS